MTARPFSLRSLVRVVVSAEERDAGAVGEPGQEGGTAQVEAALAAAAAHAKPRVLLLLRVLPQAPSRGMRLQRRELGSAHELHDGFVLVHLLHGPLLDLLQLLAHAVADGLRGVAVHAHVLVVERLVKGLELLLDEVGPQSHLRLVLQEAVEAHRLPVPRHLRVVGDGLVPLLLHGVQVLLLDGTRRAGHDQLDLLEVPVHGVGRGRAVLRLQALDAEAVQLVAQPLQLVHPVLDGVGGKVLHVERERLPHARHACLDVGLLGHVRGEQVTELLVLELVVGHVVVVDDDRLRAIDVPEHVRERQVILVLHEFLVQLPRGDAARRVLVQSLVGVPERPSLDRVLRVHLQEVREGETRSARGADLEVDCATLCHRPAGDLGRALELRQHDDAIPSAVQRVEVVRDLVPVPGLEELAQELAHGCLRLAELAVPLHLVEGLVGALERLPPPLDPLQLQGRLHPDALPDVLLEECLEERLRLGVEVLDVVAVAPHLRLDVRVGPAGRPSGDDRVDHGSYAPSVAALSRGALHLGEEVLASAGRHVEAAHALGAPEEVVHAVGLDEAEQPEAEHLGEDRLAQAAAPRDRKQDVVESPAEVEDLAGVRGVVRRRAELPGDVHDLLLGPLVRLEARGERDAVEVLVHEVEAVLVFVDVQQLEHVDVVYLPDLVDLEDRLLRRDAAGQVGLLDHEAVPLAGVAAVHREVQVQHLGHVVVNPGRLLGRREHEVGVREGREAEHAVLALGPVVGARLPLLVLK
mmetsp:Transcript_9615/g.28432  ORF Transcript_9615/g.28432 Transcript_9615/m.28432 type:complete len:752 (-) Transcript_9615:820-3075(-)